MSEMKTKRLESGERIPAGYFGNLWDDVRSKTLYGDGRTCRVNRTLEGTTITVLRQPQSVGGGGGGDSGVGVLTSGPSGGYGAATWQPVADDLTPNGATVPVIVLPLK